MARDRRVWPWKRREPSTDQAGDERADAHPAPSRWTSNAEPWEAEPPESPLSPYGYADDDGGIRQVESAAWRRPTRTRPKTPTRGFQPRAGKKPLAARSSSRLTWQLFGALVLVASGYALEHDPRIPSSFAARAVDVFDLDYTSHVQPALDRLLTSLHIRPISLDTAQAGSMHAPVFGRVIEGYGPNHPEVWVEGDAKDVVQAAAAGTVLGVYHTGSTYLVKIDHGSYGVAFYAGLGFVDVQPDEVVLAGAEIGTLPARPAHPVFRFSLEKDGKYENPAQFVTFAGGSA